MTNVRIFGLAMATAAGLLLAPGRATAQTATTAIATVDCSFVVGWTPNTTYDLGDQVTFNGNEYQSLAIQVSVFNIKPNQAPLLWKLVGACSVPPPTTTNCSGVLPWAAGAAYQFAALVTFNGVEYSSNVPQVAVSGTQPPNAPLLWAPVGACSAQINSPPFDFNDAFYTSNGVSVTELDTSGAGRFGLFRLTGPPARFPGQTNWVIDPSNNDPTRNTTRIKATTGGYIDDGTGRPIDFISIIAFLLNQNFFTGVANARGIQMSDIVSNFEAYAPPRQILPNGVFAGTPCGTMGDGSQPCFPVTSIATPTLRHDWRFSSNRSPIDQSAPFGYFCDDLLGIWIITYQWFTNDGFGPHQTAQCKAMLTALGKKNGISLDGTPIVKVGDELNFLEGTVVSTNPIPGFSGQNPPSPGCMAEGNEDPGGADGGAVWLICPTIPDPRSGAITHDAFLDSVHRFNGEPLDPQLTANFVCLQNTGQYCNGQ